MTDQHTGINLESIKNKILEVKEDENEQSFYSYISFNEVLFLVQHIKKQDELIAIAMHFVANSRAKSNISTAGWNAIRDDFLDSFIDAKCPEESEEEVTNE